VVDKLEFREEMILMAIVLMISVHVYSELYT